MGLPSLQQAVGGGYRHEGQASKSGKPGCQQPTHLLRLLAELVGDMKVLRALLAAAVPPTALRLLPGAGMGAGLRTARPRLPIVSPGGTETGEDGEG